MDKINQFLTFRIKDEEYALCVSNVKEILEVPQITRIPRMPAYMRGVINLRGSVVPVIDLRKKFSLGDTETTAETAIIVIEIPLKEDENDKQLTVGIFADAVHKVLTIEESSIEPPPKIGLAINTAFIAGMGHVDNNFITILEIAEILSREDIDQVHTQENQNVPTGTRTE
jgi:purine-binding chemotaxis protein CheW